MTEEKSWVSTYIDINGYKITATETADTVDEAMLLLLNALAMYEKDGARAWVDKNNLNVAKLDMDDVESVEFGEEDDPFVIPAELEPVSAPTNPTLYGVVDFRPPAGDLNPGDEFEILVDQYTMDKDKIIFCKEGNEYPEIHTHNLNDYGKRDMQEFFGANWDTVFVPTVDVANIPGGAFIVKIKGSNKRRDRGSGKGNVFRNLSGARRP